MIWIVRRLYLTNDLYFCVRPTSPLAYRIRLRVGFHL